MILCRPMAALTMLDKIQNLKFTWNSKVKEWQVWTKHESCTAVTSDNKITCLWTNLWQLFVSCGLFTGDQVNETHYSWNTLNMLLLFYLQETAVIAFMVWGSAIDQTDTAGYLCFTWKETCSSYWQFFVLAHVVNPKRILLALLDWYKVVVIAIYFIK